MLIVDCDYPQHSIFAQRERELSALDKYEWLKQRMVQQFSRTGQKIWNVLATDPSRAVEEVNAFLETEGEHIEVVLFDLPGTINAHGVLSTLSAIDEIFVPMKADKLVMESTITFAKSINEYLVQNPATYTRSVHLFWTMVDRRERTPLYDQYEKALAIFGLSKLDTHVPYRSKFSKELSGIGPVYRSTLFPPDRSFARDGCIESLAGEILSILTDHA